ncbi:MAG: DUF805 domain-containing protein [Hyphomonadaceae bacterium]|nr:DUF805 domain-containing protein [Hyphomonadaceae bacterium]
MSLPPAPGGDVMLTREYEIARAVIGLVVAISYLSFLVRRAHDISWSGKIVMALFAYVCAINGCEWLWPEFERSVFPSLLMLPAALAVFAIYFVPGKAEANKFGAPPPGGWFAEVS